MQPTKGTEARIVHRHDARCPLIDRALDLLQKKRQNGIRVLFRHGAQ